MNKKQETFASLMQSNGYRYDLRPLFDDFLTIVTCTLSMNPVTKQSYEEDLYMETIGRYPKELVREFFPRLYGTLIMEMEDRYHDTQGNDVLGEFYEQNFCRRNAGQFFTPNHICDMMAKCLGDKSKQEEPLRILDPTCGSGRTLVAAAKSFGFQHKFFGIDIDHTCVKMTVINLFLNGVFHGEVMCADSLSPNDFRCSYALSFLPFGVFKIKDSKNSWLWHAKKASFEQVPKHKPDIVLPSQSGDTSAIGSQLHLF